MRYRHRTKGEGKKKNFLPTAWRRKRPRKKLLEKAGTGREPLTEKRKKYDGVCRIKGMGGEKTTMSLNQDFRELTIFNEGKGGGEDISPSKREKGGRSAERREGLLGSWWRMGREGGKQGVEKKRLKLDAVRWLTSREGEGPLH